MSHTQKRRRASDTRCARRSLVELTAAASRAVDDGLFVLSSGIAASNPRSEHTGEKTPDQAMLATQAMAPSPVAVLESRKAAAPRKDELLDSDTTTEMMVKIAKDYQNRAFENIKASLNAASDHDAALAFGRQRRPFDQSFDYTRIDILAESLAQTLLQTQLFHHLIECGGQVTNLVP